MTSQPRLRNFPHRGRRLPGALALSCWLVGLLLLGVALWQVDAQEESLVVFERQPLGVMGTRSKIAVLMPRQERQEAEALLQAAENELRRIESLMSTWIEASELSMLNRAGAGDWVPLSDEVLTVLNTARGLHRQTLGAFDITCGPLIQLWRRAAESGRLPSEGEIEAARASSSWAGLEILSKGVRKHSSSVRLDVDGIAKGYAVDRALELLRASEAMGALVEVGGDLRVFLALPTQDAAGEMPQEVSLWTVGIRDPLIEGGIFGSFDLLQGATCTSGDYARRLEIDGMSFSHLIDPRTGRPVEGLASVTVTAAEAMTADAWATALSVLGEAGIGLLPQGEVHALLIPRRPGPPLVTAAFPQWVSAPSASLGDAVVAGD